MPVALAAACCFAVSTSLQHHSASSAVASSAGRLLAHLVRRPLWALGILASAAGFVLHALALHLGALTVVQPLLVVGLVFALPVRAALDRRIPTRRSLGWAGLTSAGLALFLVVADPTDGQRQPELGVAAALVGAGVVLAGAACWAGVRSRHAVGVGVLLGLAAGVLFGLVAGVLKMTAFAASTGASASLLGAWPLYALIGLGAWGLLVNQRAYQAAPLGVSLPVLNIVSPLVGIMFGAYVFGEQPSDRPVAVALEVLGLVGMSVGVVALARVEAASSGPAPRPATGVLR